MSLETKTIGLGHVPVNLAADPDVARAVPCGLALQNISAGRLIFYAMRASSPAPGSRGGMLLKYGEYHTLELDSGFELWVWTTSRSAVLAITEAG